MANCFTNAQAQQRGTIAYIRDGMEIRVIQPDGANDRRIWTHPDAKKHSASIHPAWHPGEKLATFSDIDYQLLFDLRWLPDASGFLFSNQTLMRDSANIFRYDFATRKVSQVTRLENEFTGMFSISPDGEWICSNVPER